MFIGIDETGKIFAASQGPMTGIPNMVEVADDDPELLEFFNPPPPPVTNVSRRQFKMQLEIAGLTGQVTGWVKTQPVLIQIAFNESGTFNRNDEMLEKGFTALGFDAGQVDQFFTEAAKL